MRILPILLCLAAAPAAAESLYKCTDAQGAVSIQSQPCPKGSTEVWKRDATPEPPPSAEEMAARAALAEAEARRAAVEAVADEQARAAELARAQEQARLRAADLEAAREGSAPRRSDCTLAHEFSDTADRLAWLELSETQRQRLRDWVVEQCRSVYEPNPAPET